METVAYALPRKVLLQARDCLMHMFLRMAFRDQLYLSGIWQACHMPEVDDEGAQVRGASCRTLFVVDQSKLIKVN